MCIRDRYQEMLQSFFTPDTLYILVWNVALPDSESGTTVAKMEEQQASWASLIQTCAPGSTVLLVASHADEVSSTELVQERCSMLTLIPINFISIIHFFSLSSLIYLYVVHSDPIRWCPYE